MMAILNAAVAGFANRCRDRLAGVVIIDASNPWHYDGVTGINDLRGKTLETAATERSSKIISGMVGMTENDPPALQRLPGVGESA
jgi:predicted dinucleotide-binding enzyme